ncbi:MAG: hypothetical protein M0P94_02475 [Candidatus Absconditabacterales bacterium]|nr:hypothetical protein [Candidatus Absconditabacterales bacterium]
MLDYKIHERHMISIVKNIFSACGLAKVLGKISPKSKIKIVTNMVERVTIRFGG